MKIERIHPFHATVVVCDNEEYVRYSSELWEVRCGGESYQLDDCTNQELSFQQYIFDNERCIPNMQVDLVVENARLKQELAHWKEAALYNEDVLENLRPAGYDQQFWVDNLYGK